MIADARAGRVGAGDCVVLVVTGAGWKDLSRFAARSRDLPLIAAGEVPAAVGRWMAARSGPAS